MTGVPPPDYDRNDDGERVIAPSRRPDGTLRKERRVRFGYVPDDEKEVYVSRGTAVSTRRRVPPLSPPPAAAAAVRNSATACPGPTAAAATQAQQSPNVHVHAFTL